MENDPTAYPRLIMGCDRFLRKNYTLKGEEARENIYGIMKAAVAGGADGVDVNIDSEDVFEAFKRLKTEIPTLTGIGDPNMNCGFSYNGTHLKAYEKQIIRTVFNNCLSEKEKKIISEKSSLYLKSFFNLQGADISDGLFDISDISLDKGKWLERIERLSEYCEYCLFGADYADWLIALGRDDLLGYQCRTILEVGMRPVSVSHWTSVSLPVLDKLEGVVGHWILSNEDCVSFDLKSAVEAIEESKGIITGFRVLRGLERFFPVEHSITWAAENLKIKHFTIGATETAENTEKLFQEVSRKIKGII